MYVCMYVVWCMYAFTYIHECMFDRRRRSPTVGQSMVDVCLKTKRDDVCLIVEDEERGCMKSQSMVSVCLIAKDEERWCMFDCQRRSWSSKTKRDVCLIVEDEERWCMWRRREMMYVWSSKTKTFVSCKRRNDDVCLIVEDQILRHPQTEIQSHSFLRLLQTSEDMYVDMYAFMYDRWRRRSSSPANREILSHVFLCLLQTSEETYIGMYVFMYDRLRQRPSSPRNEKFWVMYSFVSSRPRRRRT